MKAEDLLKQAMSEQKLSDEARERILSGALKSVPENAPEANKKTFFNLLLIRRLALGACACLVLIVAVHVMSTIFSGNKKEADSSAKEDAVSAVNEEVKTPSVATSPLNIEGDATPNKNDSAPKGENRFYLIRDGSVVSELPQSESANFESLSDSWFEPVEEYIEDLNEPASYILYEISRENGTIHAILIPCEPDILSEKKAEDYKDCELLEISGEPAVIPSDAISLILERDPASGEYRIISAEKKN